MVEEEVMMQRWLLWLGTFDDGGGNYARPQHMKVLADNVGICVCRLHPPNNRHLCLLPTCRQCWADRSATSC